MTSGTSSHDARGLGHDALECVVLERCCKGPQRGHSWPKPRPRVLLADTFSAHHPTPGSSLHHQLEACPGGGL